MAATSDRLIQEISQLKAEAVSREEDRQKAIEAKARAESQLEILTEKLSEDFSGLDWDSAGPRLAELELEAQQAVEAARKAFADAD